MRAPFPSAAPQELGARSHQAANCDLIMAVVARTSQLGHDARDSSHVTRPDDVPPATFRAPVGRGSFGGASAWQHALLFSGGGGWGDGYSDDEGYGGYGDSDDDGY